MILSRRLSFSIIIVGRVDFLFAVTSVCVYTHVCTRVHVYLSPHWVEFLVFLNRLVASDCV